MSRDRKTTILFVVGLPPAIAFKAFVASKLWGLFIVPVFSMPDIGWAEAAGALCLLDWMTWRFVPDKKDKPEGFSDYFESFVAKGFGVPALVLFHAWIITLFM